MNKLPIVIPIISSWFIYMLFPLWGPFMLAYSWIGAYVMDDPSDDYSGAVFMHQFFLFVVGIFFFGFASGMS